MIAPVSTRTVDLAYGDSVLTIEVDAERSTVVEPVFAAAAIDQFAALRRRCASPSPGRRCANGFGAGRRWRSRPATPPGRSPAS